MGKFILKHGFKIVALFLLAGPLLSSLPGCGGDDAPSVETEPQYAGLYLGSADLAENYWGSLELNVDAGGKATGTFWAQPKTTPPSGVSPIPDQKFSLSGTVDLRNGQLTATGTGADINGVMFPITVTGTLNDTKGVPGVSGGNWSVQAGRYSGSGTLSYSPPGGVTVGQGGTTGG